jgi:carbamoyl-phosphate synthase large subunit
VKKNKVFITGGAGVIGQQLVPILINYGYEIIVGDIKPRPYEFSPEVIYIEKDLNLITQKEFDSFKIDIIIHLAATFERSIESLSFFENNLWNNVILSHHILKLANESKSIKRFLFASSYLVYESRQYINEKLQLEPFILNGESRINPRNLIGSSKLFFEKELEFMESFDTHFSIVVPRIYRGYGLGSRDVISRWIRESLNGKTLEVYDDNGCFDFIYCKDSAHGIYKLACESSFEGIVDLSSGKSVSISEILKIICDFIPSTKIEYTQSTNKIENSKGNIEVLRLHTKWQPEYDIRKGIAEIIEYEKRKLKSKI